MCPSKLLDLGREFEALSLTATWIWRQLLAWDALVTKSLPLSAIHSAHSSNLHEWQLAEQILAR